MKENDRYRSKQLDISGLLGGRIEQNKEIDIGSLVGAPAGKSIEKRYERLPKTAVQTSPRVYLAAVLMILASIYLLIISFFPLVYNFTVSFDSMNFLINLFYFMLGVGTMMGALLLLKRETSMHYMADEIFDSVIYSRLEPVLEDVAGVQVNLEDVEKKLDMMNLNIQRLEEKKETTTASQVAPPADIYNYIKYFILINMTLAAFLFMLQFPLGYTPYAVTMMYIIWWVSITLEYKLWNVESAWIWVFVPTLTLPVLTIIMSGYLRDYQLFGLTFLGLVVYVFAYYTWCSYMVKGILPFGMHTAMKDIAEKLKKTAEVRKLAEKSEKHRLSLQLITFNTGMAFILFSILLFGIVLLAYAIQNSLISNVSWESIGLSGFVWKSTYSYILQILGIFLLLIGFGITSKSKKHSG